MRPSRGTETGPSQQREPSREAQEIEEEAQAAAEDRARDTQPDRAPRSGGQVTPSTEPEPEPQVDVPTPDVQGALEEASEAISAGIEETATRERVSDPTALALGVQDEVVRDPGPAEVGLGRAANIVNVPQTALVLAARAEFLGERGAEVARGEAGEAARATQRAIESTVSSGVRAFEERPIETAAQLGGSLAFSGAALGGAAAAGSRASRAARFGIQPGEEIAGAVGSRATRAVAGERASDALFPGGEPLFLSEEAAIRGAQRAASGARDLAGRARVRGVGAGVPALEFETRQEQERPAEPERPDRRHDREEDDDRRPPLERDPFEDSGPTRDPFESEFDIEPELETEIESELRNDVLRFQPGLDAQERQQQATTPELDPLLDTTIGLESDTGIEQDIGGRDVIREIEELRSGSRIRQELREDTALEQELEQEVQTRSALEQELESETETETEFEPRFENRREGFLGDFLDEDEDEERFLDRLFSGDRGVTARLTRTELDFDDVGAEVEDVDQ